jgi:hypothetical protein
MMVYLYNEEENRYIPYEAEKVNPGKSYPGKVIENLFEDIHQNTGRPPKVRRVLIGRPDLPSHCGDIGNSFGVFFDCDICGRGGSPESSQLVHVSACSDTDTLGRPDDDGLAIRTLRDVHQA